MNKSIFTEGLTMRPPTIEDLESAFDLSCAYDRVQYGEEDFTLDDLRTYWSLPAVNLAEDARLVFDQAGQLVGSVNMDQRFFAKFFVTLRIRPGYGDPRLGLALLELAETWARERMVQSDPEARVTLSAWLPSTDLEGFERYQQAGFSEIRRHWRMMIDLAEEPAAPVWPEGLALRPFVPERDTRAVFEMVDVAFRDHWGSLPHDFEDWKHLTVERADFDPSLWFIACEGEQVAGGALCANGAIGWVDTLGILRPWRRLGLGLAILQHAFGAFYSRGQRTVGLGVDSQNLTGAVQLYQRAGMHIARESISVEKELRAGVEISTQALEV
jgi:mycothiol synthase